VFEAALSSAGIPYRIRGDRAFVTRPEIRRVLDAVHRQPSAPAAATVGAAVAKAETAASLDDDARANLSVLRDLAQELEEIQPGATVAAFSEWLVRTASGDESHGGAAVELVTMHRAKGLEWDVVVVAGCEAGLLPIGMARGGDEIDEERRLFYVALTRAQERLVLTRAEQRHGFRTTRAPSPFLAPLAAALDRMRRGDDPATDWYAVLGRSRADESHVDPDLVSSLRAYRSRVAQAEGVPAYVVFPDVTLDALARRRPRTPSQLRDVPGLGAVRVERYGDGLLAILRGVPERAELPASPVAGGSARVPTPSTSGELLGALKAWRLETARADAIPAYRVARDHSLEAVAQSVPRTVEQLLSIHGIGAATVSRYGAAIIEIVERSRSTPRTLAS